MINFRSLLIFFLFIASTLSNNAFSQALINLQKNQNPMVAIQKSQPEIITQILSDVKSFNCEVAADVSGIPLSECQALVDFYVSTNGEEWDKNSGWLIDENIANWFGITISGEHVTIIELYGNNLTGEIPSSIENLPNLIELCLTNNQVSGSIPESISQIGSLEKLSLDSNELSGSIPESLSSLTNLTKISLGHNQLSGMIPDTIGSLSALQRFEIHDNEISGELPESLGQATNLLYLLVFINPLEGRVPLSYTNLTSVTDFYFFGTHLCEPSTPEFLAWKSLVGDGWQSDEVLCMDYHQYLPIIFR